MGANKSEQREVLKHTRTPQQNVDTIHKGVWDIGAYDYSDYSSVLLGA